MSNIDKGGGFIASLPFLILFSIIHGPNRTEILCYCTGVNSASNSDWLIFSFSISKSAQAWST